jgi:hypothetical protein
MQFVMKSGYQEELRQASPTKGDADMAAEAAPATAEDFSDLSLEAGFAEIQPHSLIHEKLDSHLRRNLKDPINLVQGLSPTIQQIFANCPFLFPFATKQLYFRLMSFISSIDVQRSIYFLQNYLHRGKKQDDTGKKITRQKVQIQRDKLIQSGV